MNHCTCMRGAVDPDCCFHGLHKNRKINGAFTFLVCYNIVITSLFMFTLGYRIDVKNRLKNAAVWAFGDDYATLRLKNLVEIWNANHPDYLISMDQQLNDAGRTIVYAYQHRD